MTQLCSSNQSLCSTRYIDIALTLIILICVFMQSMQIKVDLFIFLRVAALVSPVLAEAADKLKKKAVIAC